MERLVQNELLHYENSGLRDALTAKKQRKNAAAAKLLKEQEKEERRVARERAKEASTITQRGKRKASKAPLAKRKPKRAKGGAAAHPSSLEAAPAPPPKVSSRGRAITLSRKLR
ncbi:hypothetical protein CC80DRAFT_508260 [Byssothecium circinans]|uniref:Uncharacterized protein n=1 Tax=Byssothecium circinans TaxID=147558 RepID=A0A6A5TTI6_9PLEO|nr:hypothetical protein CC80DRAFT_508260 [Byssothecium circinans]